MDPTLTATPAANATPAIANDQLVPPVPGQNPAPAAPAGDTGQPAAGTNDPSRPYSTIEEAEEFWKRRLSGKDRAHAEAERTLREQIESLQRATQSGNGQSAAGAQTGPDPRIAEMERQLREAQQGRTIDQRKLKFPALAAQGVPDDFFLGDEAALAKLNALADDNAAGSFVAPTAPRREAPASPKPIHEQSKEELLAALQRESDRITASRPRSGTNW